MATFTASAVFLGVDKISGVLKKISDNVTNLTKTVSVSSKKISEFGKKINNIGKSISGAGRSAFLKITAPIVGIGLASLKSSSDIETMTVAFKSLTGSAEEAGKVMKLITDFTATTPFQLLGVGKSAKQLLGAGVSTDVLIEKLRFLGDIAAGANVPLSDMASIFVKSKNKGKAMTEELLQLSDRGIPIIQSLAKEMGVSQTAVFDLASKGKVSFSILENAMISMTQKGGIFFEQTENQSKTLGGIFSTLKDNIGLALAEIGNDIVKTFELKKVMTDLIGEIAKGVKWFKELDKGTKSTIFKFLGLAATIGPVLIPVGSLASGIGALVSVLGFLAPAITAVWIALAATPIGWVLGIVAVIIGVIKAVIDFWDELKIAFVDGALFLMDFFQNSAFGKAMLAPFLPVIWAIKGIIKLIELATGKEINIGAKITGGLEGIRANAQSNIARSEKSVSGQLLRRQKEKVEVSVNVKGPVDKVETKSTSGIDTPRPQGNQLLF